LGQVLTATGKYSEAVQVIRKALLGQRGNAEAIFALAFALERSGAMAEAEKTYLEGTHLRSTWWASFNRLAAFYALEKRDYARAEEAYRKAIVLNPNVARPHSNLGAIYLILNRFDEAQKEFRRSLEIQPTAPAWSNLGTSLFLLGRYPEAVEAFEKAVALTPKNFLWSTYLGDALAFVRGRDADARRAYSSALALGEEQLRVNPADARTRAMIARCLARLGQKDSAWRELQLAVRAAPEDPNVLLPAAGVATLLDRRAEALRWLETAVARGLGTGEITTNPDFSGLKGDPAFQALLKRPGTVPVQRP
jgi:serine/threonine-protein kinase